MTEMTEDTRTPEERAQAAAFVADFIERRNARAAQAPNPLAAAGSTGPDERARSAANPLALGRRWHSTPR